MTWTTTKKHEYAAGHHKIQLWDLTADSATLELTTGLSRIDHVAITPGSTTTAIVKCYANSTSAAVASNGMVAVTGVASGDEMFLTVWGH